MTEDKKTKWTAKRIAALTAVVLLVALYVVTFLVAVFVPVESGNIFAVCLMGTIAIPLLAWIYIWMYGKMTGKETIADLKILQTGIEAEDLEVPVAGADIEDAKDADIETAGVDATEEE